MVEDKKLCVVVTGDSFLTKKISICQDVDFLSAIKILQDSDICFTNCEILFYEYDSYPMRPMGPGTLMVAEPFMAKEIKWAKVNLVSLSNNHSWDFGPNGLLSTMKILDELEIVYAGAGRNLDEACEPKYLETGKGRVALIATCADSSQKNIERATNARGGIIARPGIDMIRVQLQCVVNKEDFDFLKKLKEKLKMPDLVKLKKPSDKNELVLGNIKYTQGENIGFYRIPKKGDIERDLLSIKDAKQASDWVFVSLHSHSGGQKGLEYPDQFICEYARACIDAGADAFLGHGPHILRGIEIYKGKPIFYSLGNFIAHNSTVKRVSSEQYEYFDLDENAKPSDFYKARLGIIPPTDLPYAKWWYESVIAKFFFIQKKLVEIKLYPIILGYGEPRSSIGYPKLARGEKASEIIQRLQNISSPWKTKVEYKDEIGIIEL